MSTYTVTMIGYTYGEVGTTDTTRYTMAITGTQDDMLQQVKNHAFHMVNKGGFEDVQAVIESLDGMVTRIEDATVLI